MENEMFIISDTEKAVTYVLNPRDSHEIPTEGALIFLRFQGPLEWRGGLMLTVYQEDTGYRK